MFQSCFLVCLLVVHLYHFVPTFTNVPQTLVGVMQQVMVACITISGKFSDTINSFLVYLLLFLPSMILSCDGSSAIFSFMTVKYIPQTPSRLFNYHFFY